MPAPTDDEGAAPRITVTGRADGAVPSFVAAPHPCADGQPTGRATIHAAGPPGARAARYRLPAPRRTHDGDHRPSQDHGTPEARGDHRVHAVRGRLPDPDPSCGELSVPDRPAPLGARAAAA